MKIYKIIVALLFIGAYLNTSAQVTLPDNIPAGTNYVGFNNTSIIPLPIRNEGDPRINISSNLNNKFAITELGSWTGLNGLSRTDVQRTTLGLQGETNLAWSMLHYSSGNISSNLKRDWFNVGTTYSANQDLMYVGLMERPELPSSSQNTKTDAVIAWGADNSTESPDNFRLLFLRDGVSTDQGLETMRVTPWGNVGIGSEFTNAKQPQRKLVVQQTGTKPQFRIGQSLNPDVDLGINTDFETSSLGNLHIKPRISGVNGTTALGFFSTEETPFNTASIKTTLDVGGLTRIRQLPDSAGRNLIIGYQLDGAQNLQEDYFLGRLEFEYDTCLVLSSAGTWVDRCNPMGDDLDWESDGTDVWTGTGTNNYPGGKVGVGVSGSNIMSKLHIYNEETTTTNPLPTGIALNVDQAVGGLYAPVFSYGVNIHSSGGYALNIGTNTVLDEDLSQLNFGDKFLVTGESDQNYAVYGQVSGGETSNTGGYFSVSGEGDYNRDIRTCRR